MHLLVTIFLGVPWLKDGWRVGEHGSGTFARRRTTLYTGAVAAVCDSAGAVCRERELELPAKSQLGATRQERVRMLNQ